MDLVSILIPAFNAERSIGKTIRSALAQTWARKEVIVVDDGSSDMTLNIARSFESKVVKVVTQQNTGACGARNAALGLAQGSYMQFLDADDLLAPDKISRQLHQRNIDANSFTLFTAAWARFYHCTHKAHFLADSLWRDLAPVEWLLAKFIQNAWMNPTAWLVSRRLIDLAGPWDERLTGDDDGEYACRLVAKSQQVKFVPDSLCFYRIGVANSLSSRSQRSPKGVASFFLATRLSIAHLLSLQDSEVCRRASVTYLQHRLRYFYPEHPELVEAARGFARELGGDLTAPTERVPFKVLSQLVSRRKAEHLRSKVREARARSAKVWDCVQCSLFHSAQQSKADGLRSDGR